MPQSIEVGISILHPNFHDLEDRQRIQAANARVFNGATAAFAENVENESWTVENRYPAADGPDHGEIIFRRFVDDNSVDLNSPMIDRLCQRFFNRGDHYCLDSIRQGQDVLFRPATNTGGHRIAKCFGGYFALEMARSCEATPTFSFIDTPARNVFSDDQMLWFKGSMNTVLSVRDCQRWLHDLTEFIPSTAWSSNDPVANRFTSHAPSLLQIETRRLEIVLGMVRQLIPRSSIDSYDLIETDLEGAELQHAINDATDTFELTVARLHHQVDELLYAYSMGRHAPEQVNWVLETLDCCNNQRGQLYALTNKEAPAHRAACYKWAAGAAVIGLATLVVVCWPLVAAAPLVAAPVATAIGVTGSLATAQCIEKAHHSHLDSKIQDVVHKLGNTMLSLHDDDDRLIGFAERMAEMFNIRNVMENWNDPIYKEQYVRSDWTSMRRDIAEVTGRIRLRRQPYETGPGNPQPYMAHHFHHYHQVGFPAVDHLEWPSLENFASEGSIHPTSDSDSLSLTSDAETWDLFYVFGDSTDSED